MSRSRFGIAPVFAVTAFGLVLSLIFTYWVGEQVMAENDQLLLERTMIGQLDQFISVAKDAETGQRGYLLTGDEHYLEPYHQAVAKIQSKLQSLEEYASKGDLAVNDVREVRILTDMKLAELAQTIALRRKGDFNGALALVRTDQGKIVMDQIRSKLAGARQRKEGELANTV